MAEYRRLIDADELMDYCHNTKDGTIDCNDIARFPSIDIVFCKDCKHLYIDLEYDDSACDYYGKYVELDDFCSYGERKDERNKE